MEFVDKLMSKSSKKTSEKIRKVVVDIGFLITGLWIGWIVLGLMGI